MGVRPITCIQNEPSELPEKGRPGGTLGGTLKPTNLPFHWKTRIPGFRRNLLVHQRAVSLLGQQRVVLGQFRAAAEIYVSMCIIDLLL